MLVAWRFYTDPLDLDCGWSLKPKYVLELIHTFQEHKGATQTIIAQLTRHMKKLMHVNLFNCIYIYSYMCKKVLSYKDKDAKTFWTLVILRKNTKYYPTLEYQMYFSIKVNLMSYLLWYQRNHIRINYIKRLKPVPI